MRVKKLEWRNTTCGGALSEPGFLRIVIVPRDDRMTVELSGYDSGMIILDGVASLDSAKQAAQDYWDEFILGEVEPDAHDRLNQNFFDAVEKPPGRTWKDASRVHGNTAFHRNNWSLNLCPDGTYFLMDESG